MRTTARFIACLAVLVPFAAHAESTAGFCEIDPLDGLGDSFDWLESVRPLTVIDPSPTLSLCETSPLVRMDESLDRLSMEIRIPLAKLDTRPLDTGTFAGEIAGVDVPEPWSFGETKWRVEGSGPDAVLVIDLPNETTESPSAWHQVAASVGVTLKSGQFVNIGVASSSIVLDETASQKKSLERQIGFRKEQIADVEAATAAARQILANPAIPTSVDTDIVAQHGKIAALDAEAKDLLAKNAARWGSTDDIGRVVAFGSMANGLEGADAAAASKLANEYREAHNARAWASAEVKFDQEVMDALLEGAPAGTFPTYEAKLASSKAALAVAEAAVGPARNAVETFAKDLMEKVYVALDNFAPVGTRSLGDVLNGRRNETRWLESLEKMQKDSRDAQLLNAKTRLASAPKTIRTLKSEIASREKEIAKLATTPIRRTIPGANGAVCPTIARR